MLCSSLLARRPGHAIGFCATCLQARIFSDTDVLVASHGAATANMVFLPPTAGGAQLG